jgi:predicted metal-dependent HD superfamily phosphohydrolase
VQVAEWESQNFNLYEMDWRLDTLAEQGCGPFAVDIFGEPGELARAAGEILTRCQRWMDRRNEASRSRLFDRILAEHRDAHDLSKPLVRADYDHALDTWQWTLRLDPDADLAVQLAALFHDVERLASEADARVEHRAADYQAFKDDHAARGAELAAALLARVGVDAGTRERAARLIAEHEHLPGPGDADAAALSLLNDADALSFFSLNSAGYLDYFGPEATRRKVAYTRRRLRPQARRYLDGLRLRPAVAEELEALAA